MSDSPVSPPQIEDDEIDLVELFAILLQYRKMIIITTLVVGILALAAMVVTKFIPPDISPLPDEYTSNGRLLLNQSTGGGLSSAIGGDLAGLASLAGVNVSSGGYGPLVVHIVKSNSILDSIASEFGYYQKLIDEGNEIAKTVSRDIVRSMIDVQFLPDLNIVEILVTDIDPLKAKRITNRLMGLVDERFGSIGINKTLSEKALLEQKLTDVKLELTRLEAELKDFQTRHGILTVEQFATEQVTILARARSELILKEMEISTYSDFSMINDPVLLRMRSERNALERLILQLEEGRSDRFSTGMLSQKELPELALEFSRLERDLRVQAEIYKLLTQQYELVKLKVEGEAPVFQILDYAEVPEASSSPDRKMIIIIATMITFFTSCFISFLNHFFKKVLKDEGRRQLIKKGLKREL
ncbi:GumC family protein [Spirochaeta lutea]|uniref:Uncharacterized protein n=1 Tax=Spirochaeta lutea TaxID=1480694 RepID=A0A098QTC4_9SPIO|nr:GNVR domain-containing protein [Spirochaeta lutea]KGE71125.1 hypothetical protein DC28_12810 [Spirochaeta lutea]